LILYRIPEYLSEGGLTSLEQSEDMNKTVKELRIINKKLSADLDKANAKLRKRDSLNAALMDSMSHDLRNQLSSIMGFLNIMLQGMAGEINGEQKNMLQRSYNSSKHLLNIISNIIDITRIEARRIKALPEEFKLNSLINEAVEFKKTEIETKGLAVDVSVTGHIQLKTDRKRLLQCITQYLDNAVKFTDNGNISIEAVEVNDEVEITVRDTGTGIEHGHLPGLFDVSDRPDRLLKTSTQGAGLGLYLTNKIVSEILRGNVHAASNPGKGSSFSVRIPKEI
jgi:signal transduction histidine kinase